MSMEVNKPNYVARGAAIGLGVDVATRALAAGVGIKTLGKDAYVSTLKTCINAQGKGKFAAIVAATLALSTAIGAGIGKLVENAKAKKAEKAE